MQYFQQYNRIFRQSKLFSHLKPSYLICTNHNGLTKQLLPMMEDPRLHHERLRQLQGPGTNNYWTKIDAPPKKDVTYVRAVKDRGMINLQGWQEVSFHTFV